MLGKWSEGREEGISPEKCLTERQRDGAVISTRWIG